MSSTAGSASSSCEPSRRDAAAFSMSTNSKRQRLNVRDTFLSFSPPAIGPEEIAEVVDTLTSDWITTGPKTNRFETEFAASVGAPAALALFSATDAMQVALAAMGVK